MGRGMKLLAMVAAGAYWLCCGAWLTYDYPSKVTEAASDITLMTAADAAAQPGPAKVMTAEEKERLVLEIMAYTDAPRSSATAEARSLARERTAGEAGRLGLMFLAAVVVVAGLRWVALGFLNSHKAEA